jgi:chromosome segregation ATPase
MEKGIKSVRTSPLKSVQRMPSRLDSNGGSGLATKILDLQIQLAERENEYSEMRESNEFLINENSVLEESRQEYERELSALKTQRQADSMRLIDLERRLAQYETQSIADTSMTIDGAPNGSSDKKSIDRDYEHRLEQENARLQVEVNELKGSLQIVMFKSRDHDQSIETLRDQLNVARNEKQKLGRIVADLKVEQNNSSTRQREELEALRKQLQDKEEMNQKLVARYLRHRQVWEENQEKANFEIKKLDEVIDNVIATIKNNLDKVAAIPAILMLLKQLTNEE